MMDDMQNDEHRAMIATMIKAAEDYRRSNRYPADHVVLCVLPDWMADATGTEREDLLMNHHVRVISRTEMYGEEGQ